MEWHLLSSAEGLMAECVTWQVCVCEAEREREKSGGKGTERKLNSLHNKPCMWELLQSLET
jgi:hypothetical protein